MLRRARGKPPLFYELKAILMHSTKAGRVVYLGVLNTSANLKLLDDLVSIVKDFTGDAEQGDDQTVVVLAVGA